VVADALSRKETIKPTRVHAFVLTVQTSLKSQIVAAKLSALLPENLQSESLRGMEKQFVQ
jgi:hypothetical protein